MYCKLHNGVPFTVDLPKTISARDDLSDAEFNEMVKRGLEEAKADESVSITEAFTKLREGI